MNSKRRALLATLFATTTAAPANAGCLDWLFGTRAASVPYAAGYAPQATITPLGPPRLVGSTYASPGVTAPLTQPGFAPYAAAYTPYSAGYAGLQPAIAAQAPSYPPSSYSTPAIQPQAYQAQAYQAQAYQAQAYGAAVPGYGIAVPSTANVSAYAIPYDNPSVLTGQPVTQASAIAYMGNPYAGSQMAGAPMLPPAAYVPAPHAAGVPGGFLSRLFGTNYQTSYYGVPTTSYRPVTQVDPSTGALVTVQQPCTSLTQQVQRSPYLSLQPAASPPAPYYSEPVCGGEPPRYAPPATNTFPSPYAPAPYAPSPYAPAAGYPAPAANYQPLGNYAHPSGVSQATALAPYGAAATGAAPIGASQIPSTSTYNPVPYTGPSAYPAPLNTQPLNAQPLTGYPNGYINGGNINGGYLNGAPPRTLSAPTGDNAPVAQPQLDANRPAWSSTPSSSPVPSLPPSGATPGYPSTLLPSNGALEAPPLPTTPAWPATPAWPDKYEAKSANNFIGSSTVPARTTPEKYSDIAPIPAADDYRAPAWGDLYMKPSTSKVENAGDQWPAPPRASASLAEPRTATIDRPNQDESWRYASTPTSSTAPQPAVTKPREEAPRSDAGWFVIEPR